MDPNQASEAELDCMESGHGQSQMLPPIQSPVLSSAHPVVEQIVPENMIGVKRSGSHLVPEDLEMANQEPNTSKGGNVFDCIICLKVARDPVLTCCGHLFCWPCFYNLPFAYSNLRECPVCNGGVTEADLIPVYGQSSSNKDLKEAGLLIPPRPVQKELKGSGNN